MAVIPSAFERPVLLRGGDDVVEHVLRKLAVAQGMRPLAMEALSLVDQDITTIPEVIRTLFGN